MEGGEVAFVIPGDEEVSYQELAFWCGQANKPPPRGRRKRKVVDVQTTVTTDKRDAAKRTELHTVNIKTVDLGKDGKPVRGSSSTGSSSTGGGSGGGGGGGGALGTTWRQFELHDDGMISESLDAGKETVERQKASNKSRLEQLRKKNGLS
eukprot:SAG22_NODE_1625_length_3957_cov_3.150078_2_plen_151_part_00